MKKRDLIEKDLELINKKGDLYDVIALKERRALQSNYISKNFILFISRILYLGVILEENFKRFLASVSKTKKYQDEIREEVGVNIDIIKFKPDVLDLYVSKNIRLGILYQENNLNKKDYITNLRRILDFANTYNISKIYLRKDDLLAFIDIENIDKDNLVSLKEVLGGYIESQLNEILVLLNPENLKEIIPMIEASKVNKNEVKELAKNITDYRIKLAIEDYLVDSDIKKLKERIKNILELTLNEDNNYKDCIFGKVEVLFSVSGIYLKMLTINQEGLTIDSKIIPINKYLEESDNDIKPLIDLYLYLVEGKRELPKEKKRVLSFYDKLYISYQAKRKKKIKRVRGLYSKKFKWLNNFLRLLPSAILFFIMLTIAGITATTLDYTYYYFTGNGASLCLDYFTSFVNIIEKSFNLELDLINMSLETINTATNDVVSNVKKSSFYHGGFLEPGEISSLTGDALGDRDNVIAKVTPFTPEFETPRYYAIGYATDSVYNKGTVNYKIESPQNINLKNSKILFKISYPFNNKDLSHFNFANTIYPLGYDLVSLNINDGNSIVFIKDNSLSLEEQEKILKMNNPEIVYEYGVSSKEDSFTANLKDGYTKKDLEVKNIIIETLGLSSDATLDEIVNAIKSKYYSKTPIKDAGLTRKIIRLNKNKYFKTIASLDSLVCNLANSLVVEASDDLIYVVGYLDNGNGIIESNEAHAWAMSKNGEVYDATPFKTAEVEVIQDTFNWGIEKNIPLGIIISFIILLFSKKYGKDLIFNIKLLGTKKVLNNPNIYSNYAKINEELYGGVNHEVECSKEELVSKISDDFKGFSKEELKELKEKLQESKELKELVSQIPFISSNEEEIKRCLERLK